MKALLAGLLLLGAAAQAAAPATRSETRDKIKDVQQQRQQLKQQLQAQQKQLKSASKQEQNLLGQLESLNRQLVTARRESVTHVRNLGIVQDKLQAIEARLKELRSEEGQDRAGLRRALLVLYKSRSRSGPALLFSAQSPAQLAARARYLRGLSQAADRRIRGLQDRISQVQDYQVQQSAKRLEFERSRQSAEAARAAVERVRQQKAGQLQSARSQKARSQEAVKALERRDGSLQGLLGDLQKEIARQAAAAAAQAQRKGGHARKPSHVGGRSSLHRGLAWPVRGRLVSRYGKQKHPIFNTPVFNRGIEIEAPFGASVAAVAGGTVLHAAPMEGFGDLVVVDHGGGMMSVYGYASKVLVQAGQGVAEGDLLAEVGEGGASSKPGLYFEIRQGAKALDPFTYLRRR